MIWLTADLHLGHAAIIEKCGRPFSSVEEMDQALISVINAFVKPTHTLYIAGDLTLGNKHHIAAYRERIKCGNVILIRGNHDRSRNADYPTFQGVHDHFEFKYEKKRIVLNHYPMESWRGRGGNGFHFHGHVHGTGRSVQGRYDVGVDNCLAGPICLERAIDLAANAL